MSDEQERADEIKKQIDGYVEGVLTTTDSLEDFRAMLCRAYLEGYSAGQEYIQRVMDQMRQEAQES